jgi:lysophosphatidate acyltransferase
MGLLKGVTLALGLVFFGGIAFLFSLSAFLLSPAFPSLRYLSNSVFLVPFSAFARWVVGIRLRVENAERTALARPAVLIGNHQTGLDLALISQACTSRTVIVGKRELLRIPVFGWYFAMAGNLLIDRADKSSAKARMDKLKERLKTESLNLAIFPEGTRSKTGEILPFKKGAFYMAFATGCPIIPVVCSNLQGKAIWESFDLKGGNVVVSVLPPLETRHLNLSELGTFTEQVRGLMTAEFSRVSRLADQMDLR